MLVGGGIVAGVVLIFIEMAYKRHYGKQEREEVVARAAFDRWRTAVKVSFFCYNEFFKCIYCQ